MATFFKIIKKTVKHWYIPLIVGLLFLLTGIYIFTTMQETYGALAILFSLSFLISGILEIWFSIQNRKELEGWGWYLTVGIFSLLIGILLISQPGIAVTTLPLFVGFTLLFRSVQGLGFAFELKNYGVLKWGNIAIASVLGIIFSIILLSNPIITGISLVVATALAFIFSGINSIVLSFYLKKLKNMTKKVKTELRDKIEELKEEYYDAIS